MFKKIIFDRAVYNRNDLPISNKLEIIICGRSNVGKSSFINSFFNTNLAKTSSIPGKTRSLNFYLIDDKYYFIDFPGYGYAKASMKDITNWTKLIDYYFSEKRNLVGCLHIMDSFVGPTILDIEFVNFVKKYNIEVVGILNKCDKTNQKERYSVLNKTQDMIKYYKYNQNLFFYSAVTEFGKKDIYKKLREIFDINQYAKNEK